MTKRPLTWLCATLLTGAQLAPALLPLAAAQATKKPPAAAPAVAGAAAVAPAAAAGEGPFKCSTSAANRYCLNFPNAEIEDISRALAAILKRQIVVDPRVKGTMRLYSDQDLTQREVFLNYLAALRGLGYAVIESGGLLKVVPEAEAKLQSGSVSVGSVVGRGDQILTQVFRIQHENANNLVTVLRPLITPNNTINANPGNNTLVVTDYADNLQRLAKIIAALDVPAHTGLEVFPLQHALASDLAPIVQRFADGGAAAGAAPGTATVSVLADPRTNALLIRAPNAARLAAVIAVIDKLDRPAPTGGPAGNIYVVYLKNADAVKLAQVLRAAYGAGAGAATGGAAGGTGLSAASPAQGQALATAGGNAAASPQATTPVATSASPSTGGFIQADPATNSLIISAPEPVYRQLRGVIDQLDARRAQVYVESMIVKMDAIQAAEFGFQWQTLLGKNGDKYGVVAGTNFSAATGSGANIINLAVGGATGAAVPGTGLNVGLVKAINGVYTLGALARFLETNTGANILSTPNLVSLDNEEAKIVIGQNVPFVTGTFTNTGTGTGGNVNPFQTIERKDVGLTLRVKPQIGESGTVRMVIFQENSTVTSVSSTAGPTTDKSSIETTVVVDDGQIMVLGGLLKDDFGENEDQVPGLASLPLIGGLFKSESRKRTKSNLLVFLRPVVMRTQEDANALTLDRYDAIRAQQINGQPRPSTVGRVDESVVIPELRRPGAAGSAPAPGTPGAATTPDWGQPATGR
ncbi:type II secretion system secretin GspD [Sphaerotilus mobilis]|uniref:Type II secretion system protein D (GspD) n=1 Tax=Sphaerotilus mobilis TaxID=47994 RepID=A0A4Q7LF36_9BURK|nr:type II secretion system secretin GspD [Sphaerotilus mobilis]RZS53086.1 type II secretion system protein D (GspD) [Sphaerotilus mobilis]